jgi:hypothetical protein
MCVTLIWTCVNVTVVCFPCIATWWRVEVNIMATADGNYAHSWPISSLRSVPSLFHRLAASKRVPPGPVERSSDGPDGRGHSSNVTATVRQPARQDPASQVWNCKFTSTNTYLRSNPQRDAIWCCESDLFRDDPNVLVEWLTLLYSGDPWFKSRPGDQLSCLSFSWFSSVPQANARNGP